MIDTSARLLRVLSLLQARHFWTGMELADRLEITPRTLRRDIDRLRTLGYAVAATGGPGGGYRLDRGSAMPPLLLEDNEAVAIAVSLRSAVDTFAELGETAVSALLKLNQLLPARLRKRVSALQAVTVSVTRTGPVLSAETLTILATACRDCRQVSIRYEDRKGRPSSRTLEPLRLAHTGNRRWYLVAWDLSRSEWRTLRVDRIKGRPVTGASFIPRELPADVERYVAESIAHAPYRFRAKFSLVGPVAELAERIPPWVGVLEPFGETRSLLSVGAETPEAVVLYVMLCGVDFELLEPEDLRPHLGQMIARLERAVQAPFKST
jgi:predicted DNA-binding transcriptional regulator YafY